MFMQRILVHMCADACNSVFIWRSEIGLYVCAEDVCSYVYSCMCLCVCVEPESGLYVCAEGCLFICVRLHVPLCVSGARDQSWVLCVPQEPSTFFFKIKRFLLLTVCINEEYDIVNLNIILSDARQRH